MTTISKKQIAQIKALKIQSYIHEEIVKRGYSKKRPYFNFCFNGAKNGNYTYKFTSEEVEQIQEVLRSIINNLSEGL